MGEARKHDEFKDTLREIRRAIPLAFIVIAGLGFAARQEASAKQAKAAEPPPEKPPLTREKATTEEPEIQIRLNPRRIEGKFVTEYQLVQSDKEYLNWLNAQFTKWTDWNGESHLLYIPDDVYENVRLVEEMGGVPSELLLAIAATETQSWDVEARSYAGARGRWQIMPDTWRMYQPFEGADHNNPFLAAVTASNLLVEVFGGVDFNNLDQETFIDRFTGRRGWWPIWNAHVEQASVVFDLYKTLLDKRADYLESQG